MKVLQDAIEKTLAGLPRQMVLKLVSQKLAAQGVTLSARERKLLAKHVLDGGKDILRFRRWQWWDRRQINLEFTHRDSEQIEQKFTDFIDNRLQDFIDAAIEDLSRKVLVDLKRKWSAESRRQRHELNGFRKRLYDRWRLPLEGLRMLLTISRELGDSINDEIRIVRDPSRKHLIEVLTRLHARACQITAEVICLLEGGFADGAMARWRTLHEVAAVASFIVANGENLAERYVLHQIVESSRAMMEYEKCRKRLGYEPIEDREREALQKLFDAVIARFGEKFKSQYGWAADALEKERPTFADIEQVAGVGHLRAHYRMASHPVHANPKGVFFKLGLLDGSQILLAGPTNAGLTEPGHGAAISLAQVSAALGQLDPTFDNTVALRMIVQIVGELGEAFGQAHQRLVDEATAIP